MSIPCRWCGHQGPPTDGLVFVSTGDCQKCHAATSSAISITSGLNGSGGTFHLWHNPDNSLFLEFENPDGKTARYTLSEDLLRKAGVLETSKEPMGGRANE